MVSFDYHIPQLFIDNTLFIQTFGTMFLCNNVQYVDKTHRLALLFYCLRDSNQNATVYIGRVLFDQ